MQDQIILKNHNVVGSGSKAVRKENEDKLSVALKESEMTRDKRDSQLMLEFHQLLAARN